MEARSKWPFIGSSRIGSSGDRLRVCARACVRARAGRVCRKMLQKTLRNESRVNPPPEPGPAWKLQAQILSN